MVGLVDSLKFSKDFVKIPKIEFSSYRSNFRNTFQPGTFLESWFERCLFR